MRAGAQPWLSTIATNLCIALLAEILIWSIGLGPFLAVQLPITLIAATAGVWLFYVQHQFEETHWAEEKNWHFQRAALHGSSHYDLPSVLRWFTGNIGIHHVHHLSSKVPFYGCRRSYETTPNCATSAASLCSRAWGVSLWCCGTSKLDGSSHSGKPALKIER